ncbi:hypothetical protein PPYR_07992 [Photinus pyralis]|uniref:MARVEL domain-containing protein n=1 Tax=Photinus pyralis TaxID=7054 RepID=A0A5N4ARY6_PHOPY|nr:uncharacterized protein LOC116168500 isoform X4 [Photinus pyralis]XP_031340245.1 uncharacterized protein LOC116168500 isoform X4 [Photinus pyralis]KAB0800112.1 hypothetical protein PPYR_07992 [Photinus pyralis]
MFLNKCCCCCSLKYGVYTWGIITLLFRFIIAFAAHFSPALTYYDKWPELLAALFGSVFGWEIIASLFLIVALKGIVEKRHMLFYPYIVVLILEIGLILLLSVVLSISSTTWHIIEFFCILIINMFTLIWFISLYRLIKRDHKSKVQMEDVSPKNV